MKPEMSVPILLSVVIAVTNSAPINSEYTYEQKLTVFNWLLKYEYILNPTVSEETIDEILETPLKIVKEFYEMDPVDGEITAKIMGLVKRARCADPDEPAVHSRTKRWARLSNVKWKRMPVTVGFKNFLTGQKITKDQQLTIMRECTAMWSRESTELSIKVIDRGLPDIQAEFLYIDGPWNTVGRGLSPTPYWPDKPSYLKLDSSEKWKLSSRNPDKHKVSMKWAMCHELGHTIGLGHSGNSKAIMYPSGVGQDESRLSTDDINGIRAIYGDRRRTTPRRTTSRRTTPRRTAPRRTTPQRTTPRTTRPRRRTTMFRPTTPRTITQRPPVKRTTTKRPVRPTIPRPQRRTTIPWYLQTPKPTPKPTHRTYHRRVHPYSIYWLHNRYNYRHPNSRSHSRPHVGK